MAKFYGEIGYSSLVETRPGVWKRQITPRMYYGEVVRNSRKFQSAGQVNDILVLSNEVSIVSDPYANKNFHSIVYCEFMGTKWKVTNVEVQFPRLILTIGGVYNTDEQS